MSGGGCPAEYIRGKCTSPPAHPVTPGFDLMDSCSIRYSVPYGTDKLIQCYIRRWLAVWLSGNALASINVVALRQTRLVPGWVTVCGRVNHLGM